MLACQILLQAAGADVEMVAVESCCGQPAYSAGRTRDARRVATSTLDILVDARGPVVVPSGSCAAMIRKVWPKLFPDGPDRRRTAAVADRTFELTEFLFPLDLPFRRDPPSPQPLTYHDSCHGLRELGLGSHGRALLTRAGYELIECENPQLCCGFGGVFSQLLPELSTRIGADKAEMLLRAAPVVAGGDAACLLHLRDSVESAQYTDASPFRHIAELLAERVEGSV